DAGREHFVVYRISQHEMVCRKWQDTTRLLIVVDFDDNCGNNEITNYKGRWSNWGGECFAVKVNQTTLNNLKEVTVDEEQLSQMLQQVKLSTSDQVIGSGNETVIDHIKPQLPRRTGAY